MNPVQCSGAAWTIPSRPTDNSCILLRLVQARMLMDEVFLNLCLYLKFGSLLSQLLSLNSIPVELSEVDCDCWSRLLEISTNYLPTVTAEAETNNNLFLSSLHCTIAIHCRWAANRFFYVRFTKSKKKL